MGFELLSNGNFELGNGLIAFNRVKSDDVSWFEVRDHLFLHPILDSPWADAVPARDGSFVNPL